jgi:N-hydroxyarylamine O-acetyltransferase
MCSIDLDAYFQRIGYTGERTPTLEALRALHAHHAMAIPYENLNPLLGLPVQLDLASLQQKLISERRGGFCFEQNLLFSHVLKALGFSVTGLAARVLWRQPEDAVPLRGHMILRIDLSEGPYIADVGFGGVTLTAPLRLEPDTEQATPHESFRLIAVGDEFILLAKLRDEWVRVYRFGIGEHLQPDYEVTCWYLCHHPNSQFISNLIAARPAIECRYGLRNNEFVTHYRDGRTERTVLTTAAELRAALTGPLGIMLPEAPELDAILNRIAT